MTTSAHDWVVESDSPATTMSVGVALGRQATPGLVVALVGPLGAGKTQFVRGVASGLDVDDERLVSSPTFVLLQEYAGRLPIYHFDTYRLPAAEQFGSLGPEEYFDGDGVCLVEWADRVTDYLPEDRIAVHFEVCGPTARRLVLSSTGTRSARVLMLARDEVRKLTVS
jgi:tRNA threonylcarbamoyladenosine biosynthesis protein TsaE